MVIDMTHNKQKTHCINKHKFTPENTYTQLGENGNVRRQCRICMKASSHRYYARLVKKKMAEAKELETLRQRSAVATRLADSADELLQWVQLLFIPRSNGKASLHAKVSMLQGAVDEFRAQQ